MNLSKFSNESGSWNVISELVRSSVEASKGQRNFINEQVDLLSPHVIITMNLTPAQLAYLGDCHLMEKRKFVDLYELKLASHTALLLNTYHFSAVMSDSLRFIDPIRQAVSDFEGLFT